MLGVLDLAHVARNSRDLRRRCCLLALDLVAHRRDGFRIWSDEDDAVFLKRNRKRLSLREEAIARMDRLGACRLAGLDNLVHQKIGLRGGRGADVDCLIRHVDVKGIPVGIRVDRHRLDAHLARRLYNAAGNLSAVGNQNFLEHRRVPVLPVITAGASACRKATCRSRACGRRRKHAARGGVIAGSAIRCRTMRIAGKRRCRLLWKQGPSGDLSG